MRYLCDHDIKEDLVGRHAELFWPDDNLWYLIEIQVGGGEKGGGLEKVGRHWVSFGEGFFRGRGAHEEGLAFRLRGKGREGKGRRRGDSCTVVHAVSA